MADELSEQPEESAVTFLGFILSLAHTAAVHFGDVADPVSGQQVPASLPAAQQMIDILALLEEKTRGNLTAEERQGYRTGGAVYPEMDSNWMPVRNRSNDYLIDRRMQKTENFTGIVGVTEQDAAIQDSQGRIADRTREMLGPTDIGVVQFRRLMLDAAKKLAAGGTPPGLEDASTYRVRAGGIVAPASANFDEVMQLRFGDAIGRMPSARETTP